MNIVIKSLAFSLCLGAIGTSTSGFTQEYSRKLFEEPWYVIKEIDPSYEGRFCIKAEDGCCWEVQNESKQRVREDWQANDRIVIMPTSDISWWADSKDYCLKNKETQTIAFVRKYKNPYSKAPAKGYIRHIEGFWSDKVLVVEKNNGDYFRYEVYPSDASKLHNWNRRDTIMIGSNMTPSAQKKCSYNYLIINMSRNETVRANALD